MNETILGKLTNVRFGVQDGRIGLFYTLEGSSCCISNDSCWDPSTIKVTEHTKWTEEDRNNQLAEILRKVSKLLEDAKVDNVSKLNGIPVEFTFEDGVLSSWRVLTEVL